MNSMKLLGTSLRVLALFGMIAVGTVWAEGQVGDEGAPPPTNASNFRGGGRGHGRRHLTAEQKAKFKAIRQQCEAEGLSREECHEKFAPPVKPEAQ